MEGYRLDVEWRPESANFFKIESEEEGLGNQFLPYVDRLIRWLNVELQKEYEWISSDEAIARYCDWNEMIFTEKGNLYVGCRMTLPVRCANIIKEIIHGTSN